MQGGRPSMALRMAAKRPERSLPLRLRTTAPAELRCSWARQPSCFTSCSHSGPEGGARFRTGDEGTMNAVRLSTAWM